MPVGDLPGWRQVFAEDFTTNATTGPASQTGSFLNRYGSRWDVYHDGWNGSSGCSAPARYYPSKVLNVSGGVLNKYLHSETLADPHCGTGTRNFALTAAILPKVGGQVFNQTYGKYTARFKADSLHGYRTAFLLWPQSGVWPRDGEINFPEGGLDSRFCAFMHHQNGTWAGDQYAVCNISTYSSWHTASVEWSPSRVDFLLDGQVVGTTSNRIPNTPMRWVLQTEACHSSCPASGTAGNLQIDWVVVYARN
jgi:hypothetical protein